MAKILTKEELSQLVKKAIEGDLIDCEDQYNEFLQDVAFMVSKHFGGTVRNVEADNELGGSVSFEIDENVPSCGGVFREYDKDVTWENGEEYEETKLSDTISDIVNKNEQESSISIAQS
jgi:hypothetical protein